MPDRAPTHAPLYTKMVSYAPMLIAPVFLTLMLIFPALLLQSALMIGRLYMHIYHGDSIADILVRVLEVIEICLGASIVYIMLFSSMENFVTSLHLIEQQHCPSWMRHISLSEIKIKVMGTIITIVALDLVAHTIDSQSIDRWDMGVRVGVLAALSMATYIMARIEAIEHGWDNEPNPDAQH